MLWFKKQADASLTGSVNEIEPAELEIRLDSRVAIAKLNSLLTATAELDGVQPFVDSLRNKHQLFQKILPEKREEALLDERALKVMLDAIFPARRRLASVFEALGNERVITEIFELVYGETPIKDRIDQFCELVPYKKSDKAMRKQHRALWDFATEVLHFRNPEAIPLMSRWVWDLSTDSGAVREFVHGSDQMSKVELAMSPETFQAIRVWFVEVLSEEGFYRDAHFLIDLLLAHAYADYVKSMSMSMGMMDAEYGGRQDPTEFLVRLLGIDGGRIDKDSRPESRTVH